MPPNLLFLKECKPTASKTSANPTYEVQEKTSLILYSKYPTGQKITCFLMRNYVNEQKETITIGKINLRISERRASNSSLCCRTPSPAPVALNKNGKET